jgi:hypothetical protein
MDNDTLSVRNLFMQVWANGYTPLANLDKRCLLKGWPTLRVDQRQVELWSRSRRWPAIGLRLEPPLVVVDIDVLDAALAMAIARLLPRNALRRVGQPPKMALFLRYDGEPFYRIATRRWAPDAAIPRPAWSAVEVFAAGGGGKQFGCFGPHKTDDKSGAVLSRYDWPGGRSPANTPLSGLPVIRLDTVLSVVSTAEHWFAEQGFSVDRITRGGMHRVDQVFDLDAGMVFRGDAVEYGLPALETAARAAMVKGRQIRVTGSFTGDPHSGGSLRCRVGISHLDRVYIHDFKSGLTHHPKDAAAAGAGSGGADAAGDLSGILKLVEALR